MENIPDSVSHYFLTYGYMAIFLLFFISEAGIPMPFPNYLMVIFASYLAFAGRANIPLILLCTVVGMVGGAYLLYLASRKGGYPLLMKYGRFIKLYPERVARVEQWFQRRGALAIFVGRLCPGIRIHQTAIAAGVFRMGGLIYKGQEQFYEHLGQYELIAGIVMGSAIVLAIIGWWLWRRRQAARSQASQ
jgi:membrane protein DedA with SNARE-associated domain